MEKMAMTVKEAAEALGCSPDTVYKMCKTKEFPHIRIGASKGNIRIPRKALEEYVNGGKS